MNQRASPSRTAQSFLGTMGEALFLKRRALGLTLAQTAKRAGVSRQTVYVVETGESDPSLSTFVALCMAVELEPADVLRDARGRRR